MKTIGLTSPLMKNEDVLKFQMALKERGWYSGDLDGIAGVLTCQAFYRAKFHLGYATPDQFGGDRLYAYVTGARPQTNAMKALAAHRHTAKGNVLDANEVETRGELLVKIALGELGETEHPPNSNRSKYSVWYGLIGAWCAEFVSWVCWKAGRKFRYAYVPYVYADARAGKNNLSITLHPVSGNLPLYDWPRADGTCDHIGIFAEERHLLKYAPTAFARARKEQGALGPNEFWAVEGNTAYGNDSNGGIVMIRKRNRDNVRSFAVVG